MTPPNPSEWIRKHGDYLFSLAVLRVGNKQTAEDLLQETFLAAIRAINDFRGDSSERTWLVSILKNKIIDHYRKRDVLRETASYLDESDQSFHQGFFEDDPMRYGHWRRERAPREWAISVEPDAMNGELGAVLQQCMQSLPEKLRSVFTAKYIEEEKSENICKELGITSSNYWVLIHRAKIIVRECLGRNWFDSK